MVVTPDFEKSIPFAADGNPWSFQTTVQPGFVPGKGEVRLDFVDEQQTGVRVRIAPRGGGPSLVRLVAGQVDEHAPMERNPIMNLAEGDYNYRLPFDLRVLSGDGKVQLYLGFLGMAPELIQYELLADVTNCTQLIISSVDATMTISNGETAPLDVPSPDLTARPPVGDSMPRWSEFSGVHYIPRSPFRLYRGLFYDPVIYRVIDTPEDAPEAEYRPWVTYVSKSELPEDCVEKIGPFSGQTIHLRESRIREALTWAKEHDAFLIQGRDVQKRTDYYDPAEVTLRKDEVYWSCTCVRRSRRRPLTSPSFSNSATKSTPSTCLGKTIPISSDATSNTTSPPPLKPSGRSAPISLAPRIAFRSCSAPSRPRGPSAWAGFRKWSTPPSRVTPLPPSPARKSGRLPTAPPSTTP